MMDEDEERRDEDEPVTISEEIPAEVPEGMTRYTVSVYNFVEGGWNDRLVVDLPSRTRRNAAVAEAFRRGRIEKPQDLSRLHIRVLDELNAAEVPIKAREDQDPLANLVIG